MAKMTDTMDLLENAKIVAQIVFKEEYHYGSEVRLLAIQNVLLAAYFCNENHTYAIADLAKSVKELEITEQPKSPEQSKTTKLVRD